MKKAIFTGSACALVTPMLPDGSLHFESFGRLIEDQIRGGTDALVVCGTTGEAATLSDGEQQALISYVVKKTAGRVPVIAGAGSNCTAHAVELCHAAKEAGADGLLAVTPYYNKTSQAGLIQHFTKMAEATNLPLILYNVPSRTGCNLLPATCKELAKLPTIVGIKEASGNLSQVADIAADCPEDFSIYSGNDDQILPILSLGGKGVISVVANVLPKETHDLCATFLNGRTAESRELQLKLLPLIRALFSDVNPIPVKEALNLMGYSAGGCRLPLWRLDERKRELLKAEMRKLGLVS